MVLISPEVELVLWAAYEKSYANYALNTLGLYEFMITAGHEIDTVWKEPWSVSSLLFLSNRWVGIFGVSVMSAIVPYPNMFVTWAFVNGIPIANSCIWNSAFVVTPLIMTVNALSAFQVSLFSAFRVYAVTSRSILLSVVVFLLGSTLGAALIYQYIHDPFLCQNGECDAVPDSLWTPEIVTIWNYVIRAAPLTADIIVLLVTWMKTIPEYWASRKLNRASSLVTCLARDGAWYFMAILAINLVLIFYQINPLFVGVISQLATSLPPILLNRCIINLRSLILSDDSLYPDRSTESDSESDSGLGPPMMSTNLDDIGEDTYDDIATQERTRRSDVEKNEW